MLHGHCFGYARARAGLSAASHPAIQQPQKIYHQINLEILDIGSGAGFPGIVVAILKPDIKLALIDSSRKKHLFLMKIMVQNFIKSYGIVELKNGGKRIYLIGQ